MTVDTTQFFAHADKNYVGCKFSVKSTAYIIRGLAQIDGKVFFDVTEITKSGKMTERRIGFNDIKAKQVLSF